MTTEGSKLESCDTFTERYLGMDHFRPRDLIRQLPGRKFSSTYPPSMEDKIKSEIEDGLKTLNSAYRSQKRKPSGSETYAVRQSVYKKYRAILLQLQLDMELWSQSERTLKLLRARGLTPQQEERPSAQILSNFIGQLDRSLFPELEPSSPYYIGPEEERRDALARLAELNPAGCRSEQQISPNDYFVQAFPALVADYGFPFFSSIRGSKNSTCPAREELLGINSPFFSALLGGDRRLGHDVVYYVPESTFYFLDPLISRYAPTTEAKMRLSLISQVQRQVWGMDASDAQIIWEWVGSPKVLDTVIAQAKALHGVGEGFFEGPRARPRLTAGLLQEKELTEAIRSFIREQIHPDESSILTVTECVTAVRTLSNGSRASLPSIKEVKSLVQAQIREIYHKGLRNDLFLADGRTVAGWKGLAIRANTGNPESNGLEIREIRESGLSGRSMLLPLEASEDPFKPVSNEEASGLKIPAESLLHKDEIAPV